MLVTSSVPKVPKTVKLVRTRSGTDRIELIADPVGLVMATAVNGYPPDGVDPLDFVGVGVGLGAGAGGDGGGASVGVGFGADDVALLDGFELLAVPLLGAAERELADAVGVGLPADSDALPVGVPLDAAPLALWLPVDVVPATVCADVLENSVVMPNAATTLSSVARQVRRDRRRSPVSRLALRLRCLMDVI
jgi:hypothetical protein